MKKTISILFFISLIGTINAQEKVSYSEGKYFYKKLGTEINSIQLELIGQPIKSKTPSIEIGYKKKINRPFVDLATKIESKNSIEYVLHLTGINQKRVGIWAKFTLSKNDTIFLEENCGAVGNIITSKDICKDDYGCYLGLATDELIIRLKTGRTDTSQLKFKVKDFTLVSL